ncbi:hypothetical protein K438DRAFT_1756170 [Mycena galopus ATCC 62051]|nr:hypothetical protein K438DRAFT_1756170 [Mycena galopus ATCC 62051]
MSEPAPYKRTRVYIACVHCRRRKTKCLTDDSEGGPCKRCIRLGLQCQYTPIADEQEESRGHGSDRKSSGNSLASQPVSPATQTSKYRATAPRPPQKGDAPYLPVQVLGSNPFDAPSSSARSAQIFAPYQGGQQICPENSPYPGTQGVNLSYVPGQQLLSTSSAATASATGWGQNIGPYPGGQAISPANSLYFAPPPGYSAPRENARAPALPYSTSLRQLSASGHPSNHEQPSVWPAFQPSSSHSHAFTPARAIANDADETAEFFRV